ncbi:MAG: DUF2059 domain-containing protein [Candidatus Berkiella sp.]
MNIKAVLVMALIMLSTCAFADTVAPITENKPSKDYVKLVQQWADVTHFATNAASASVENILFELRKNPKNQQFVTPELISDLKQFFYEVYSSKDYIMNISKVYSQFLSIDEMIEMIKFYNTPLGKKIIEANSALTLHNREISNELLKKREQDYMKIVKKHIKQPAKEPAKK